MAYMNDIAAAVDAFGTQNVGLIWGLGMIPWESDAARDEFLNAAKNYYKE